MTIESEDLRDGLRLIHYICKERTSFELIDNNVDLYFLKTDWIKFVTSDVKTEIGTLLAKVTGEDVEENFKFSFHTSMIQPIYFVVAEKGKSLDAVKAKFANLNNFLDFETVAGPVSSIGGSRSVTPTPEMADSKATTASPWSLPSTSQDLLRIGQSAPIDPSNDQGEPHQQVDNGDGQESAPEDGNFATASAQTTHAHVEQDHKTSGKPNQQNEGWIARIKKSFSQRVDSALKVVETTSAMKLTSEPTNDDDDDEDEDDEDCDDADSVDDDEPTVTPNANS
ncbi:hypothetical protein ROZALSC1DRAFT_24299, partial [Rozella allomycis CSF55]